MPAGTVIVAFDQVEGASAFGCYPEDYDRMERILIPEEERESFTYAGSYHLSFPVNAIGDLLDPLPPLDPRPPNRLPRVTGRPSPRQRAELERRRTLEARIAAVDHNRITKITERAWVRRNQGQEGSWQVLGPDGVSVPLESWDVWFDGPPGEPARRPDVTQPGSARAVVGQIRDNDAGPSA